jgi:hypothetical protein
MRTRANIYFNLVICAISLAVIFTGPSIAGSEMKHGQGAGHGMARSNMNMLGVMGMAKGVDEISIDHGKMMMKNGRDLWNELMSGDTMMKMHAGGAGPADDPMMKFTHQYAEAQLKVMDLLGKMPAAKHGAGHDMATHHQHEMLNHALKMGLEGSNMVMLGQMGMAKGVDDISTEHGKIMMKHANSLFNAIMSGDTMMDMHGKGTTPEKDASMGYTHKLAEAQMKVLNMLKMMPSIM